MHGLQSLPWRPCSARPKMQRRPVVDRNAPADAPTFSTTPSGSAKQKYDKRRPAAPRPPSTLEKMLFPCSIFLVAALLSPVIYVMLTRLGIGAPFPRQAEFSNAKPLLDADALEIVAELPAPPGNIAVSSTGRIFFNFHPEFAPREVKVAELKTKTTYTAFPDDEFQSRLVTCLSMRIDRQDRLWLLDFKQHGIVGEPVLYAFALKKKDEMVKEVRLGKHLAGFGSMLNDFQVDPSGEFIYIADTSIVGTTPALIVYSLKDDFGYRLLSSHPSMYGMSTILRVQDSFVQYGPVGLTINVDSIALDRSGSKLYYGALTGDRLYAISTSHLLHYLRAANESQEDRDVLDAHLPQRVHLVLPQKPVTDGISTDAAGNIYLTALEHSALAVAVPLRPQAKDGQAQFAGGQQTFALHKLVQNDELLRWPDGISFGPDGMYVTNSALHLKFVGKDPRLHEPFHILKLSNKSLKQALGQVEGASYAPPPAGH